jgi:hypothetical protein
MVPAKILITGERRTEERQKMRQQTTWSWRQLLV